MGGPDRRSCRRRSKSRLPYLLENPGVDEGESAIAKEQGGASEKRELRPLQNPRKRFSLGGQLHWRFIKPILGQLGAPARYFIAGARRYGGNTGWSGIFCWIEKSAETSGHAPRRATEDENLHNVFPSCESPRKDFRGSLGTPEVQISMRRVVFPKSVQTSRDATG